MVRITLKTFWNQNDWQCHSYACLCRSFRMLLKSICKCDGKFYQWVPMTTEVDWCRYFIFLLVSSQIDLSSVKYFFPIWSNLHCHQSPFFGKSHDCFKLQLHSASRSWGLGLGPQWLGKSMLYAVPFDLQIHKYTAVNRLKVRFYIYKCTPKRWYNWYAECPITMLTKIFYGICWHFPGKQIRGYPFNFSGCAVKRLSKVF